jgi:RHH-type transcriptional regulator, rel operon repressor / antitoxin RelB
MLKDATLTVRVKQNTRTRLDAFSRAVKRSKSYVIEEALEQYLEINEWQTRGIQEAITEADKPGAVFVDHDKVQAKWEAKVARKMAKTGASRSR